MTNYSNETPERLWINRLNDGLVRSCWDKPPESHIGMCEEYIRADIHADLQRKYEELVKENEWQPIETAPKDGTIIWAWLHETGIRRVRWYTTEEIADHCGGIPEDYNAGWGEIGDISEEWWPKFWMPINAIPLPTPPTTED